MTTELSERWSRAEPWPARGRVAPPITEYPVVPARLCCILCHRDTMGTYHYFELNHDDNIQEISIIVMIDLSFLTAFNEGGVHRQLFIQYGLFM